MAARYGINTATVAEWRKRASTADRQKRPKDPRSTVLSVDGEAVIVAFRRHTLPPRHDYPYDQQPTIPQLTPSAQHRCLQHHGISRLFEVESDKPFRVKFNR
jgi:hypothetical protein